MTDQRMSLITQADIEAAKKIKMLLPYGDKLTDDNALALMAYSRLHALDPFNGECYFLVRERKDDRGNVVKREELGVYPGIKGKRKKAKEQIRLQDPQGWYKCDYETVPPEEIGMKASPDIALVIKATLRDSVSGGRYILDFVKLKQVGLDQASIESVIGKPPVWVGYGVVKTSELRYIKQTPMGLAKKRAESDATNQRYDLPFANEALADDVDPEVVGLLENGDTPSDEPVITAEAHTVEDNLSALGYDEPFFSQHDDTPEPPQNPEAETAMPPMTYDKNSRPYDPQTVKAGIEKKASKHKDFIPTPAQENLIRYGLELCFAGQPSEVTTDKRHTLLKYLTGQASTKQVSGKMFKAIIEDWLQMKQDEGGEYRISNMAAKEAQAIVTAALVGEGQQAFV